MKLPKRDMLLTAFTLAVLSLSAAGQERTDAEVIKDLNDNWYRTELLVFVRSPDQSDEVWDPLPALGYPERYRHLIESATLDKRLEQSNAYASVVDDLGVQRLQVPAPAMQIPDVNRPDAQLAPDDGLLELFPDANDPGIAADSGQVIGADPNTPVGIDDVATMDDLADAAPDPNQPLIALAYRLLPQEELDFLRQARGLRQRGQRVLFHGAWWAPLDEPEQVLPIALDNTGDPDTNAWPELQGSVHVYRSRYIHVAVDLWLNTLAGYLPAGWQIPPPPAPLPSVLAQTLSGVALNPWAPVVDPLIEPAISLSDALGNTAGDASRAPDATTVETTVATTSETTSETSMPLPDYPWRHAITHAQTRRMRSGEIHYLDHPVIGVIVRVTPVDETTRPMQSADDAAFRERHGLPLTRYPRALPE